MNKLKKFKKQTKEKESIKFSTKKLWNTLLNKYVLLFDTKNSKGITIDDDGTVHGVTPGTCIVTVSSEDGNKSDTCNVLVIKDEYYTTEYNELIPFIEERFSITLDRRILTEQNVKNIFNSVPQHKTKILN